MLRTGVKGEAALRVTTANTALAHGSGELEVLATPALAALVEKACWQSIADALDNGESTVGTKLVLAHTAPTPIGMVVRCETELTDIQERKLTFTARMMDEVGEIGHATHERYIVDAERFQNKANRKQGQQG